MSAVAELLAELPLVDAHCHFVLPGAVDQGTFELGCTEAGVPAPAGVSYVDSQLGLAVRRWCAPALDLPAHAPIADYLRRRAELDPSDLLRRLLRPANLGHLLVDTGIDGGGLCTPAELSAAAAAPVSGVVRLERVAQDLASTGVTAAGFEAAVTGALHAAAAHAAGFKSIVAYRAGLDVDPVRPSRAEVRAAAGTWLSGVDSGPATGTWLSGVDSGPATGTRLSGVDSGPATGTRLSGGNPPRLTDRTLLRFLLWAGLDTGLPLQLHTGFGDRDLALHRADPALLQPFLEAAEPTGVPIVLLHCYPYHRQAAWLAAVHRNVYADVGLTLAHVGARATEVLAGFTELAPFGKLLFSTDAYLLPELYLVGAAQFRHALATLLTTWTTQGALAPTDATRLAHLVGRDNANRVYGRTV